MPKQRTNKTNTMRKTTKKTRNSRSSRASRKLSWYKKLAGKRFVPKNKTTWAILAVFVVSVIGFIGSNIQQENIALSEVYAHNTPKVQKKRRAEAKKWNDYVKKSVAKTKKSKAKSGLSWKQYNKKVNKNVKKKVAKQQREVAKKKAAKKKPTFFQKFVRDTERSIVNAEVDGARALESKAKAKTAEAKKAGVNTTKGIALLAEAKKYDEQATGLEKAVSKHVEYNKNLANYLKEKAKAEQKLLNTLAPGYNKWTNVKRSKSKNAPAPLGIDSCLARGFGWNSIKGSCNDSGKDACKGSGSLVKDTYNYCSDYVTTRISKKDCHATGRKWLGYNGCAQAPNAKAAALQCRDGVAYNKGGKGSVDYCGGAEQKAAAAKVKLRPVGFSNYVSGGGGGKLVWKGGYKCQFCGFSGQCTDFVAYVVRSSNVPIASIRSGKDMVRYLVGQGWKFSSTPVPGSVFSIQSGGGGNGHTGIVEKVIGNNQVVIAEANYPRPGEGKGTRAPHRVTVSTAGMTYAVPPQ